MLVPVSPISHATGNYHDFHQAQFCTVSVFPYFVFEVLSASEDQRSSFVNSNKVTFYRLTFRIVGMKNSSSSSLKITASNIEWVTNY